MAVVLPALKAVPGWVLLLAGIQLLPGATGNQILLRSFDPADGAPHLLTSDNEGHLFVVSTLTSAPARLVKLDLNGARLASIDLPPVVFPAAVAPDAHGNIVVAGQDANIQGFVFKVDPQLRSVLFKKSLPARVNAAAVDGAGNIYLTGVTGESNFPLTPDAYQSMPPLRDTFGGPGFAFMTKLSPAGDLLYSTYFGDGRTLCRGGSFCVGKYAMTTGTAIAVDAAGAVVIAGVTTATNLPTTPGALAATCTCGYDYGFGGGSYSGFIARIRPGAAQQLESATYLNSIFSPASVGVKTLGLDAEGNVVIAGSAASGLPTTAGALQPSAPYSFYDALAFIVKLNAAGTNVLWGTYFGQLRSSVTNLYVDANGQVIFGGQAAQTPSSSNSLYPGYVARLSSDGSTLIDLYQGPAANFAAGPGLTRTSTGGFAAITQAGPLWIETQTRGPSLLSLADSASGLYPATVSPRELISLYGLGIGPSAAMPGEIQDNAFTSSLGGYQVLFDGAPAPLLYAGSGQLNAVVPRGVTSLTHLQIVTPSGTIDGPTLPVAVHPAIFRNATSGFAAAVNQDGSVNSYQNPAKPGTIVSVWVTGAGGGLEFFPDGAVVPLQIIDWSGSVVALANNRSLEVAFAGYAPGTVAGVVQVNFRIPDSVALSNLFGFYLEFDGVRSEYSTLIVAR